LKPPFTLGVRADVQPKSSIPIGAKVEIGPKAEKKGYHRIWETKEILVWSNCKKFNFFFFSFLLI
jgi:hypothetical protein